MRKMKLFFTALAVLMTSVAFAQNITVTGNVRDASNGDPVPFSSVHQKGTMYGVITDADGHYSITVTNDAVLVFSSVGYKSLELPVNGNNTIDADLKVDSETLDDVIVVAYGTVSREANTGAVTTLKSEGLADSPATSVDKMLAGKMAGVKITSGSGQPGSTSTIRVRGTSSVNAGNEPLWVIDGIPVMNGDFRQLSNAGVGGGSSTTFLNPNDVESITVLKDAAAASVYGSRAANGVILVTTKTGKSGKARFSARAKYGVQQLINDRKIRPLTGEELIDYRRTAAINAGHNPDDPEGDYYFTNDLLKNGTTDWYRDLTKLGSLQEYEINASGGNQRSSFYSSLAYHKNEGVFYGVGYDRFTARINADMQLTKTLKAGARVNFSYSDSDSGQMGDLYYANPIVAMWGILPWTPMYNEDGSFNDNIMENSKTNPRAVAAYDTYNDKDYRAQGNLYLEWKPIPQLTFKTTNGFEAVLVDSRQYWAPETNDGTATLFSIWSKDLRYTTSNTITYADMFASKHNVRVTVGQEAMTDKYDYIYGYSPEVDPMIPYPNTSTGAKDQVDYYVADESLLSFFGIADYNYDSRYFIQGSVRADGSSLFGANNRWGLFWSVGGSWNMSQESWMQGANNWLSQLKIRASYGVNGNNNISPYRAFGTYGSTEYNGTIGMLPSTPSNQNLSWEKNKTWNVGIDYGFFDHRLTGSIEVYDRLTTDMLLNKTVPYTTGFGSNFMNVGSIRNRGLEFMVEGDIFRTEDFNWSAGFNIAFNKSKVLDLGDTEFLEISDGRAGGSNSGTPVRIVEGMSLYNFYLRDWYGVNPSTGDGLWWTADNQLTNDRSKARYVYCGSPEPVATGGFNTEVSWKGLALSAYFEFVAGHKVVETNNYIDDGYDMNGNTTTVALNYWKKPGDTGVTPKVVAGNPGAFYVGYSTRFLKRGDYMRIKDVTLSYTLPQNVLRKIKMNGIKVYVSALNPYTFHDLNALDPEVGYLGYTMGATHSMVKSFIGGIEVSF
jgi:TonB-linked SusC/RagA family outer membrane protein